MVCNAQQKMPVGMVLGSECLELPTPNVLNCGTATAVCADPRDAEMVGWWSWLGLPSMTRRFNGDNDDRNDDNDDDNDDNNKDNEDNEDDNDESNDDNDDNSDDHDDNNDDKNDDYDDNNDHRMLSNL